jgi:hypothetical protein
LLQEKKNDPNMELFIVFGKNEQDLSKSMTLSDFNFFKEFPNVTISYEKRLHAKYYANEHYGIITSMNLYRFSQDNNIEVGVITKTNIADMIISTVSRGPDLDQDSWNYFLRVIKQAQPLYQRTPTFETTVFGLSKKYMYSTVSIDKLSDFFAGKTDSRKTQAVQRETLMGFCIRTGSKIPFNPKMPMCEEAYANWSRYKNSDYREKYCHYSGEPSNGETTFARPILAKFYNKLKER